MDYYVKYLSKNTEANDFRSLRIHKANTAIIATATLALLAFLTFYFGDFDKANKRKPIEVSLVQPVIIKGELMSTAKPPPPPAPPPPRQIREGIEVIKRPVPTNQGSGINERQ